MRTQRQIKFSGLGLVNPGRQIVLVGIKGPGLRAASAQ